ncbi:DUF1571 domain-containing protein [Stieleria sp. TO1_6]|uniref:DUF1571 domain-containing protein n=1 Tax=Stieleria tagensis TaxID=2956795 RepID=UPI00209B165D|nr:DUF1571 domain-containing protein [Stieleria tagensis]MCO8125314.1 DUF1571 domain-containing protein [Stieleria tagensis]
MHKHQIDTMDLSKRNWRWFLLVPALLVSGIAIAAVLRSTPEIRQDVAPTDTAATTANDSESDSQTPRTRPSSIAEVLDLASAALKSSESSLNDYTARFAKQERDASGNLTEKTEMNIKIQTRTRNESNDAPMRIYLNFSAPQSTAGREVIWGRDLYDGKMAVHETSMLLSWKTVWLDPTGMLAMAGQRYPIWEIGLVRLIEKLIERGQRDLDNPDVTVTITRDHEFDGRQCELIQAVRSQPGGGEDDFSLAEIVYDPERLLILSYQSFGWPSEGEEEVPLLESYQYRDLKTNVGLTEADFDVVNEAYGYPK